MNTKKMRSLRFVSIIIILISFLFCEAVIIGVFSTAMTRMIRDAEEVHLEELNHTVDASITEALLTIHSTTRSWSSWDETYNYVLGDNPDFIEENLADGSMMSLYNVDLVIIKDLNGDDVHTGMSDKIMNSGEGFPAGLSEHILPITKDVLANQDWERDVLDASPYSDVGFINSNDIPYMICTMPIILSDETGDPVGTFTFLKIFDETRFEDLTNMNVSNFNITEVPRGTAPVELERVEDRSVVTITTTWENLFNDRAVEMSFGHDRHIYSNGMRLIIITVVILSIGLLVAFSFFYALANKYVISSFGKLASDIENVDKNVKIDNTKHESFSEIQAVSVAINDMMDRIDQVNQAEKQSQISLNILTNMLNGIDAYIYVTDPDTDTMLFINDKMQAHFNLSGMVVGKTCWQLLQNGFTERCDFCPCRKLEKLGDVVMWEEFNSITNRYYRNTDTLIEWAEGKLVHMQHSVDLTEIKIAENAVQKKYNQQQLFTEVSQSFLSEEDGKVLTDRAVKKIGKYLSSKLIILARLVPDQKARIIHEWIGQQGAESLMANTEIFSEEDVKKIKEMQHGQDYYVGKPAGDYPGKDSIGDMLWTPIIVDGAVWGIICFGKEDGKWAEENIRIGMLIGSILSGAINKNEMEMEIVAAKELAEEGSRSKGEFLSRMSHEMRTPMNAIIGMTDIAKSTDDVEKKEYCLDKIDSASKHLLGVINDILDMSKIEANKFELSCDEFNLDDAIMNVLNVILFRVEEKHQDFSLYVDPAIPSMMWGDAQRLSQIITNLVTNAVKFTPEKGSIGLNVNLTDMTEDSIGLKFEVIDTGIGISHEQQQKLFNSFEQADGSITRKFGGTGLGLAISKKIVELMGGDIHIESEEGRGSSFIFNIITKPSSENRIESEKESIRKSDLRVLVVDDAKETCDYFVHIMNTLEIKCDYALSAKDALALIESATKPYDIVFVDWKMPEMDGLDLARTLRAQISDKQIIVMISAYAWNEMAKEAKSIGVNGYVPKPLFPSMLIDCISRFINLIPDETTTSEDVDYDFSGKVALLAEDIEINREIVTTILSDSGIEIECAENGVIALDMFSENPEHYDIIFMDMQMPEMDGLEATRKIRLMDNEHAKNIPIIAMTANVFKEDADKCLEAGMNDHIGKPIDFNSLFGILSKYFNM